MAAEAELKVGNLEQETVDGLGRHGFDLLGELQQQPELVLRSVRLAIVLPCKTHQVFRFLEV